MSERLKNNISLAAFNTIRIAIFAVLAIVFQKWWIVLFSGLFLLENKYEKEMNNENS